MSVALIVIMGAMSFAVSMMRSNSTTIRSTRVTQDLRMTSEIIARELKRSGFNQNAIQLVTNAPYESSFDTMEWGATSASVASDCRATRTAGQSSSCVVFSYDRPGVNDSNTSKAPTGEEYKGFRRIVLGTGTKQRGVVQMFVGTAGSDPSCDDGNDAAGWITMTPPGINVTKFALSPTVSAPISLSSLPGATVKVRRIGIQIDGRPVSNVTMKNEYARQVCDEVRIRSDEVAYTPPTPPDTP